MKPLATGEYALLAAINLVWAFNVVAVKLGVTAVEPLTAAFLRYAIVLVVCLPWLRWMPGRMLRLAGATVAQGALWIALLNIAFSRADNIAALSLVSQLGAPFSLILAVLFLGERIKRARTIAIGVSVLGVVVIGFDPAVLDEGLALWLAATAALMYAAGSILLRGLGGVPGLTVTAWLALTSAPLLLVASLVFEPGEIARVGAMPVASLWPIAYSALFSSIVGHAGLAWLLGRHPVSTITPFLLPSPLIAATLAIVVLGGEVTPQLIVGGALVVAGVAVISIRTAKKREAAI